MSTYPEYRKLSTPMLLELVREAHGMEVLFDPKGRLRYVGRSWPPVPTGISRVLLERQEELKSLLASMRAARGQEVTG